MTTEKQLALQAIEQKKNIITEIADKIWEYAELSLQEFRSSALYCIKRVFRLIRESAESKRLFPPVSARDTP